MLALRILPTFAHHIKVDLKLIEILKFSTFYEPKISFMFQKLVFLWESMPVNFNLCLRMQNYIHFSTSFFILVLPFHEDCKCFKYITENKLYGLFTHKKITSRRVLKVLNFRCFEIFFTESSLEVFINLCNSCNGRLDSRHKEMFRYALSHILEYHYRLDNNICQQEYLVPRPS